MSDEASSSVTVNGNMEDGTDHGKMEDPDSLITSIKKFKETVSQNGTGEKADVPETCNTTDAVNESDDGKSDNSKEKAVKENGLNTSAVTSDEENGLHTEITNCEKSGDITAEDHCDQRPEVDGEDQAKIKEDAMEVDESKSDCNINETESPMETDSTDAKCEVEESKQADKTNDPEIAKNIPEGNVENNIDEKKSESGQDEEKQEINEGKTEHKSDEGNVENNTAHEKVESGVGMVTSTEQKNEVCDEEQNSLKSENDKTEDRSESSEIKTTKKDCSLEINSESDKKDLNSELTEGVELKDSSKEEEPRAKDSSKEEKTRAEDSSKEEEPRAKDTSKEDESRVKDISKEEDSRIKASSKEEEQLKKDAKSIDTLTDEDGSEFIITINEDDSGSEKEEEVVKTTDKAISQPVVQPQKPAPTKTTTPSIPQKPDAKISLSLSSALGSKSVQQQQQYVLPNQVVSQTRPKSAQGGPMQYYPIHLQTTTGTSQYMQSVMVAGKSVLVPVSSSAIAGTSAQYLIDPKNSFMSKQQTVVAGVNSKAKTFTSPLPVAPVKQLSGQKQETYSVQKGIETIDRDADLPLTSWEMIDLVKWEIASHKPDNTFWMGLCNVNKKAELSAPAKFLFDLGSDIVKESAYKQITQVQSKKKEAGKLNDVEKENLEKMKKVVKELEDKLSHMAMTQQKCSCGFQTESENVMMFHKEHPHMKPPLNPHGSMVCAHCNFETNDGTQYSFHMESEHNMVGRVYSKPAFWQCGLCYYEHNSKNKLTNHKWKCMKHFKANQNQAPHHTDINYCLKNIYYKYQIKRPPPPKPAAKAPQHNHNTRHVVKPPTAIQPRQAQGPLLANQLQQNRPALRAPTQIPGVVYSNQAAALANRQNTNPPRLPHNNQNVRNPMQVVVRPPATYKGNTAVTYKGNTTVNQLLMRAKGPNQVQKSQQPPTAKKTVPQPPKKAAGPSFEVCEICGGYVKDRMSLRIHFFYAHKIDIPQHVFNRDMAPLLCEVCKARFWTTQGLSKHRLATQHTATTPKQSSVTITGDNTCWICHQRQANLYTHLLQFHRLSTGECMLLKRCMFCGSLSNNRKDLEIHMAAAHGVLIKGANNPPSTAARPPPVKQPAPKTVVVGPKTSVTTTGGKGSGLVRNNFCVFCCKQFADNTQLTLHCLGTHATCSSCGMVVAQNNDLKTHICRSGSVRNCPMCGVKNLKPNAYTRHISTFHLKKCVVRLKRMSQRQIREATRRKEPMLPVAGTVVIDLRPPEDRKRSASEDGNDDIYVPDIKRMKPDEEPMEQGHDEAMEPGREEAKEQGREETKEQGREETKEQGREEAMEQGHEGTKEQGREEAKEQGREETKEQGREETKEQGREEAKEQGREETKEQGREEAKEQGREKTKEQGREETKEQGREETKEQGREEAKEQGHEETKEQREEAYKKANEETDDKTNEETDEKADNKVNEETDEKANEQSKEEDSAAGEETKNDKSEDISQTKDDGNDDNVVPP